jgi:type IV pilus assembly protein PilN
MIKINLLDAGGPAVKRSWLPTGQRSALIGLVLLLCTGAGVGAWWWTLTRSVADVQSRITKSEIDLERLKKAAKLVDRAMARKAELAEKIALIDRLRAAQRGPVNMLSTVNRSIPDGLWLMELNQRGNSVQLEGRATTLTSVTDFAERLQVSGIFDRPVEIVTTSMENVDEASVVRFALKAWAVGTTPPAQPVAANGAPKRN